METTREKRPRGRPPKSFSKQKSASFRAPIAAREIKGFKIKNANLESPQADLVCKKLNKDREKDLIGISMFNNYWKGKSSPSKPTLDKLAEEGLDIRPLFISIEDIHKTGTINHTVRYLLAIDLLHSNKLNQRDARSIANKILDDIDSEWAPFDQRLFFAQDIDYRPEHSKAIRSHQFYPGPVELDDFYLFNYSSFNTLTLIPWLLSISPFYFDKPLDMERLALDFLTASLCLMKRDEISNSTPQGPVAKCYQTQSLHYLPAMVFDAESPSLSKILLDFKLTVPDQSSAPLNRLKIAAENIHQSYDLWLQKYGLSKLEMAMAIGFNFSDHRITLPKIDQEQ